MNALLVAPGRTGKNREEVPVAPVLKDLASLSELISRSGSTSPESQTSAYQACTWYYS